MPNPLTLQWDSLPSMKIIQESYNQVTKKIMKKSCLNKLHAIHELLIGYPWKLFIDFWRPYMINLMNS